MTPTYIDYVLIITKNDFMYHINALEKVLQRSKESGSKVNAEK